MNVSGQGQQLLLMNHGDGLFIGSPGGFFQIQFIRHRNHENINLPGFSPGDEGFEYPVRILLQQPGDLRPAQAGVRRIEMGLIGDFPRLQNAHRVGFVPAAGHLSSPSVLRQSSSSGRSSFLIDSARAMILSFQSSSSAKS